MNPPKCYAWLESYGSPLSDRKKKKIFSKSYKPSELLTPLQRLLTSILKCVIYKKPLYYCYIHKKSPNNCYIFKKPPQYCYINKKPPNYRYIYKKHQNYCYYNTFYVFETNDVFYGLCHTMPCFRLNLSNPTARSKTKL